MLKKTKKAKKVERIKGTVTASKRESSVIMMMITEVMAEIGMVMTDVIEMTTGAETETETEIETEIETGGEVTGRTGITETGVTEVTEVAGLAETKVTVIIMSGMIEEEVGEMTGAGQTTMRNKRKQVPGLPGRRFTVAGQLRLRPCRED